ncbi:MAG: hypothetical protein ACON4J_03890 [Parvibaculales bacterium]
MFRIYTITVLMLSSPAWAADDKLSDEACKNIFNGIQSALVSAEKQWVIVRQGGANAEMAAGKAGFWSQQAANYATVYDSLCKDD